ncbi:MAG: hypothetical protein KGM42_17410 [Hyphomicrobiales bacterium]|nr:hypothetical protein [Hyphomicrobiales bacterium]
MLSACIAIVCAQSEKSFADPVFLDQGPEWSASLRDDFYTRDQGSRLMPLAWFRSLRRGDGSSFLPDGMTRYGYLSNAHSPSGLPVGFHASGPTGLEVVGMTCAACHTRQITVNGAAFRIDGGPALVDFQSFMSDVDEAFGRALATNDAFAEFAKAALGKSAPTAAETTNLRAQVDRWYRRFHVLMSKALPKQPWGLGRLDAVGMIFNRLTGLDLGPEPDRIIADNIKLADAPVRYPFLWNAARQDQTQWPGFADNGSDVLGLARNMGEVLGVFGLYAPKRDGLLINFLNGASANFDGLSKLEDLIKRIGPPKWQWALDAQLVADGRKIFERAPEAGGCKGCHDVQAGAMRFPFVQTWATPIQNVGTDTREYGLLEWKADTGALRGAFIPLATDPLQPTDLDINILATSVIGSIAQHVLVGQPTADTNLVASVKLNKPQGALKIQTPAPLPPELQDLTGAFGKSIEHIQTQSEKGQFTAQGVKPPTTKGAYESRVLQGIWAAAPYLHNGSVATLADLLQPAAARATSFNIGPEYDIANVGIATHQQSSYIRKTTDCSDLNSGDSRCGHEFGVTLSDSEKKALLEYLKSL